MKDNKRIELVTAKKRHIPNVQRREQPPETLRAGSELYMGKYEGLVLRSLSGTYNCIGMVFANRRTWIEPDHVKMILDDDGYVSVDEATAMVGDVVVYENLQGETTHAAIIVDKPLAVGSSSGIRVLSQWGIYGEYLHDHDKVPELLGRPVKFYSERRKL